MASTSALTAPRDEERCSATFKQGDLVATCDERAGHNIEYPRTEGDHHGYLTGPGWRISIDWWAES